jgi:hypothetical protein
MTADLSLLVAFILDEFRGKELHLSEVRKKLNDASFLRDFSDQCMAGIETFEYADRAGSESDFSLYAGGGLTPQSGT